MQTRVIPGQQSPLFIRAMRALETRLPLPHDFTHRPLATQVKLAARLARQHYQGLQGTLQGFGVITGYRLQSAFDHAVLINPDGTIKEGFLRRVAPEEARLTIKGRRIDQGVMTSSS